MEQNAISQMARLALEAGSPRDQVDNFISRNYVPLPWQWDFHAAAREADEPDGPNQIGAGGARGPGKSHGILSQVFLDDMQRVPGLKALFIRQTGVAAKESFEDLIDRIIRNKISFEFNQSNGVLKFQNGSKILLGGFKDENDIDKYIGIEYDIIAIEELNQLTEEKVTKLRGSLRTSKTNWRPRLYTSFNPGGIGHGFVKKTFVNSSDPKVRYIPATYKDNPYLQIDYIDYLEGLTGDLGKAWREGDFDLFAGQYFDEWRQKIHVIEPYAIPKEWKHFIMGDYGYAKASAVYWGAISPEGQLILYRELYEEKLNYEKLAEKIISLTMDNEDIRYWVFDPAIWSKKGENSDELSGAEIMMSVYFQTKKTRLNLIQGNNDRLNGWNMLRQSLKPYLGPLKNLTAKLLVFKTCTRFIETLPALVYDKHRVEDLDTDGDDHGADAVRYGLMTNPSPSLTTEQVRQRDFDKRMREKKKRESSGGYNLRMVK